MSLCELDGTQLWHRWVRLSVGVMSTVASLFSRWFIKPHKHPQHDEEQYELQRVILTSEGTSGISLLISLRTVGVLLTGYM